MADTVAITAGTGTAIATDDISSVHYQRIKLVHGIDGVNDGDVALTNPLPVEAMRDLQRITVTSAGLTIATTAYTSGDQLGTQLTFANAARSSGGSGMIVGCIVISAADVTGAMDLVVFDSSVTLAADNAAFAISDADALKVVGLLQLSGSYDIGNNRIAQVYNVAMPFVCSGGSSLYGGLITRLGHTFFAAVTDLQVSLSIERN